VVGRIYPTYTCSIGSSAYSFDYYTGTDNYYIEQQDPKFYYKDADTNKYGWYPAACTSAYDYICEVPWDALSCPVSTAWHGGGRLMRAHFH
jgi:hypothetical protein